MKHIFALFLLLTLASCQTTSKENIATSIIGNWKLTKINNKEIKKESSARIEFKEDGKILGNNSCNNFFGSYEVESNIVTFGAFGSTKRFCAPDENNLEQEFNMTISQVSKVEVIDGILIITSSDKKVIEAMRK
jgi:heat shock protein HslJ